MNDAAERYEGGAYWAGEYCEEGGTDEGMGADVRCELLVDVFVRGGGGDGDGVGDGDRGGDGGGVP